MNLLSITSTWILVRHQWLITKMRSILTGEIPPAVEGLIQFNQPTDYLQLPENLIASFATTKQKLERAWHETVKIQHSLSRLSLFNQLNLFQLHANHFMSESKELNQKLWQDFTMRDPLTGALSRLTLKTCLSTELNRYQRHQHISTIALMDQEKFKKINDEWGHTMGDKVLADTALVIQKNLRASDKLFRYGGDEWLILMPDTNQHEAHELLERIQKIVNSFAHRTLNQTELYSAFSYGLAECISYHTVDAWIAGADAHLYQEKGPVNLSFAFQ